MHPNINKQFKTLYIFLCCMLHTFSTTCYNLLVRPMETTFGSRIRDLRKAMRFSLRELADATSIDFTYLSKLETGRFPPPSEDVIVRLSQVLGADKDELLSLANKVDSSIHEFIVNNPDAARLLRVWKDHGPSRAKEILEDELEKGIDEPKEP